MRDIPIPIPNCAGMPGDCTPEKKIIEVLLILMNMNKKKLTNWINNCGRCWF